MSGHWIGKRAQAGPTYSSALPCPKCADLRSRVVDSRPEGGYVRRRRECSGCRERFTTYEGYLHPSSRALDQTDKDRLTRLTDQMVALTKELIK